MLEDAAGEPVDEGALEEEQAGADGFARSLRLGVLDSMTPARLAAIYQAADRGEICDLVSYAMGVERFDGHIGSVLHSRRLGAQRRQWTVVPASESAEDKRIAAEVAAIVAGEGWRRLLAILQGAVLHPFATAEIEWRREPRRWWPADFLWRDQRWHVVTDQDQLLVRTADAPQGEALRPFRWIVHRSLRYPGPIVLDGLARSICTLRLVKSLGLRAWVQLAEVFGVPLRVGTFPRNSSEQEKVAFRRALLRMGLDGVALLPHGNTLEIMSPSGVAGAPDFHPVFLDWIDAQISKAAVGQTMTTDPGSSRAQAEVHERVADDIGDDDCLAIAATVLRDVVRPFVDLNYGPRERDRYPTIVPLVEDKEDLERWVGAATELVDRGLKLAQAEAHKRLGTRPPEEGEEILEVPRSAHAPAVAGDEGVEDVADVEDEDEDEDEDEEDEESTSKQAFRAVLAAHAQEDDDVEDLLEPGEGASQLVRAVEEAAAGATSYQAFRAALEALRVRPQDFVDELAARTLAARGVGDAQD